MEIVRMSFHGNSNIGVYAYTNNKVLLLPPGVGRSDVEELVSVLGVKAALESRIAGTP